MIKTKKKWTEMTTAELAEATKEFDDPTYAPPVLKPTRRELAQLRRVQRKSALSSLRIALYLDKKTIAQADTYAAEHGLTFSDVVKTALRQLLLKKSV